MTSGLWFGRLWFGGCCAELLIGYHVACLWFEIRPSVVCHSECGGHVGAGYGFVLECYS